ncbi:MAG: zinc-dependent dehydrogenase [Chthonomonadales bacterium]
MLAAVYRGPGQIRVDTVPVPAIEPGEVLVRVAACGVCGTDLKKIALGLVPPPRIFGHEMAGEIAAVGASVEGWSVGERVAVMHHVPCEECYYCSRSDYAQCALYKRTGTTAGFEPAGGGFAQYIRVMDWVVRRGMVRIPPHVSDEEATFVEPVNTCLKGLRRAGVQAGDTVLVVGQGQIGLIFTALAALGGATVYASDALEDRLAASVQFGATAVFRAGQDDVAARIRERTQGRGADVAIVCVPLQDAVDQAFTAVRPGGRVLLFAHTRKNDEVRVDGGAVCMLEKSLIGSYSSDIRLQEEAARLIFDRRLDVRRLITHRFPLERIGEAVSLAAHPTPGALKIMVMPWMTA